MNVHTLFIQWIYDLIYHRLCKPQTEEMTVFRICKEELTKFGNMKTKSPMKKISKSFKHTSLKKIYGWQTSTKQNF